MQPDHHTSNQGIVIEERVPGSFVFEVPKALPAQICEMMIARFEDSADEQYPGRIGQGQALEQSIKRSTDLVVSGKPGWKDVDRVLLGSLHSGYSVGHLRARVLHESMTFINACKRASYARMRRSVASSRVFTRSDSTQRAVSWS